MPLRICLIYFNAARFPGILCMLLALAAFGSGVYAQESQISEVNFRQVTSVTPIGGARFLVTQGSEEHHIYIYDAHHDEIETRITLENLNRRPVSPASLQPEFSSGKVEPPEYIQGVNYGYYDADEPRIIAFTANHQIMEVGSEGQQRRSIQHPPMTVHFVQRIGNQLWVSGSSFLRTRQLFSNQAVAVGFVLDLNSFSIVRQLRMSPGDFGLRLDNSLRSARGFFFQPYVIPVSQSSFVLTSAGAAEFIVQNPGRRLEALPSLRPDASFEASVSPEHGIGVRTEAVNLHVAFHDGKWWISSGNRHQGIRPTWTVMSATTLGRRSKIELEHRPMPVSPSGGSASIICTPGESYTLCHDYFASQANYMLRSKN